MATVKVLHDGVGQYNAGDIVPNAPVGLVEMADKETRNSATGLLLVEFVDDVTDEFEALKTKAKDLKIRGFANMKFETLKAAVDAAEAAEATQKAQDQQQETGNQTGEGDLNDEPNPVV